MYDELDKIEEESGRIPKGLSTVIMLEKLIKSAPFDASRAGIRELDPEVVKYIFDESEAILQPFQQES